MVATVQRTSNVYGCAHMIAKSSTLAGSPAATASSHTERSRFRCALAADAILLETTVERAAAQPELLRRGAHVAAVARQRFLNEQAFRFFERQFGCRCSAGRGLEPEIACGDG